MQLAKHWISDHGKAELSWALDVHAGGRKKKPSGYIKGTRSAWLAEDDETEGTSFRQWDLPHVFIPRAGKTSQILCLSKSELLI